MSFWDWFKIPVMPSSPTALTDGVEVSLSDFLEAVQPVDVGVTCGHGLLGVAENIYRMDEKEGNLLMTHSFLVYASGITPEICEGTFPKARRNVGVTVYLGSNRHTVFFRFNGLNLFQKNGALTKADDLIQKPTPYAVGQIVGFLWKVLGRSVGDESGMTCIEFVTNVLRSQMIRFIPTVAPWLTTPTDAYTWLTAPDGVASGWTAVAENVAGKFFIKRSVL